MDKINFTILGNPITKKNHSRILRNSKTGRPFIAPSKQYKNYAPSFIAQCNNQKVNDLNIDSPINIKCIYYMQTRRAVDLTNLLAATDDLLISAGVIVDDNCKIVVGHDGSRVRYDKENPRVEIEICGDEITFG